MIKNQSCAKGVNQLLMKIKKKYFFSFYIAFLSIIIDQFSKFLIIKKIELLPLYDPLFYGLNIVYVENKGVSFGMLSQYNIPFYLGIISVIISFYIIFLITRSEKKLEICGLSLILGGALGNGVDRLLKGYVVDFIDFYFGKTHWPAFNIADTCITFGAILFFLNAFKNK